MDGVDANAVGDKGSTVRETNHFAIARRRIDWRLFVAVLALLSAFAGAGTGIVHAQGDASAELSPEGQQIYAAINARRTGAGLAPLVDKPRLNAAAQAHANDILYNNNYSHWGTDGTLAADRVARTGYSNSPWVSENWVSSSTPEGAMAWWMNDYIHRVNILTPRWRDIGVGVAIDNATGEMIFVTVFSVGPSGTPSQPVVTAASAVVAPAQDEGPAPPADPSRHVVQQGDTLLAIAIRYDQDMFEIAKLNHLAEGDFLQIGQVLLMPGYAESGEPAIGGVGGPATAPTRNYAVSAGETLFSIAAANDMTWQKLASMNGMGEGSILQIGQVIQLPMNEPPPQPGAAIVSPAQPLSAYQIAAMGPLVDTPDLVEQYSLPETAATDVSAIPQSGQAPVVTESSDTVAETAVDAADSAADADAPQYHIITAGDTVIGIAQRYGMAWGDLLALNGLDDDTILEPGTLLRLR